MRGNYVISLLFNIAPLSIQTPERERISGYIRIIRRERNARANKLHLKILIICEKHCVILIEQRFSAVCKEHYIIYTEVKQQKNLFKYLQELFELGTSEQGTAIVSHRSKTNENITRG